MTTRTLRALALAGALTLGSLGWALAQSFPSGSIQGNAGASAAPPRAITPTAWLDRWCSSSAGRIAYRGVSSWACAAPGSTSGVQAWDADLDALAANATDGLWAHTGSGTGAARTLTAPAAGFTITNPAGIAGNPIFVLANDLAALEGLGSTGIAVRTTTDTWAQRTITGTAAEITATNGDGVSANPTLSLPAALTFTGKTVTGGTFNSPTLATPNLGIPSAATLTNATGLPISTGVSGLAANVAAFLATPTSANLAAAITDETGSGAAVFANSPALSTPNLGIPSAATLTNATGLPIATGVSGLAANIATFLATPTSANLAAAITNETGSGAAVFGTAPTISAPVVTGLGDVQGAVKYSTQSAPTQIAADQNDYNPSSVICATSTTLLINSDAARNITGLAGGAAGCSLSLINNGSFTITLKNLNGSSSAGNQISAGGDVGLVANGLVELRYDGTASKWRVVSPPLSGAGSGTVTSVACGTGLSGGTITTSGTCAVSLTTATNTLGSDTAISNSIYSDGPSMAQGTSGTWFASGSVTVLDTTGATQFSCKLWDGTTVIASGRVATSGVSLPMIVSLSGALASPAANIRISCTSNAGGATSTFKFNSSGNSKDSTITGFRIG